MQKLEAVAGLFNRTFVFRNILVIIITYYGSSYIDTCIVLALSWFRHPGLDPVSRKNFPIPAGKSP